MRRTRSSVKKQDQTIPDKEKYEKTKTKGSELGPQKKIKLKVAKKRTHTSDDATSSESDLDNYLTLPEHIDLNSEFFKPVSSETKSLEKNEKCILTNINRLSDSDSSDDDQMSEDASVAYKKEINKTISQTQPNKLNFHHLHEFTNKLQEVKKHVENYKKKMQTNDNMDINNLLALGEAKSTVSEAANNLEKNDYKSDDFESLSESEEEDWEEIKNEENKEIIPKDGVQITIEASTAAKRKKVVDLMDAMKRLSNREKKKTQVLIHKVHLLCWLAHGNYVNKVLNDENILALSLSLIPSENCYPENRTDLKYLEQILKWYKKTIQVDNITASNDLVLEKLLMLQINKKIAINNKMFVFIFISILRSLGIHCRLVLSLQVDPLKPPASELHSISNKNDNKIKDGKEINESNKSKQKETKVKNNIEEKGKKVVKENDGRPLDAGDRKGSSRKNKPLPKNYNLKSSRNKSKTIDSKDTPKGSLQNKQNSSKKANAKYEKKVDIATNEKETKTHSKSDSKLTIKSGSTGSKSDSKRSTNLSLADSTIKKITQLDGVNDDDSDSDIPSTSKKARLKPNLRKLKEANKSLCLIKKHPKRLTRSTNAVTSEDEFQPKEASPIKKDIACSKNKVNLGKLKKKPVKNNHSPIKINHSPVKNNRLQLDVTKDIISLVKGSITNQIVSNKTSRNRRSKYIASDDSDSDYFPEVIQKKKHDSDDEFIKNLKPKVKRRVQVKPEPENKEKKKKWGTDVWIEVFLEVEEKWISVDVVKGKVHCVKDLSSKATQPVSYILAWDNNSHIKDITQRYCPNWNTLTRKLRVDAEWWDNTLKPFAGPKTARDREEDDELARQQLEQPLPKTIGEYKNHPLYVLKRHLLKFEGLYPPDIPPLGFVNKEPVYSRDCVYTLHSRDIWLKHAKVVKPGETPYKVVKARPKYDKSSNTFITDKQLEIFGMWQVEDYVPPTAENGIVPRNAYGNVELFKSCMLPKGTVHLQLPGLNKIAKRMNIDCASAVVGFDFHSGWSHPTYDGFVVCQEYQDELVAAWYVEQEEIEKKEQQKIEKRVYGNWKRLIKGLLIRERLKARYNFSEGGSGGLKRKKAKGPRLVVKKRRICSDNESE